MTCRMQAPVHACASDSVRGLQVQNEAVPQLQQYRRLPIWGWLSVCANLPPSCCLSAELVLLASFLDPWLPALSTAGLMPVHSASALPRADADHMCRFLHGIEDVVSM